MAYENWEEGAKRFAEICGVPLTPEQFLLALAQAGVNKRAKAKKSDVWKIIRNLLSLPVIAGAATVHPALGLFMAMRQVWKNIEDATPEEIEQLKKMHFI